MIVYTLVRLFSAEAYLFWFISATDFAIVLVLAIVRVLEGKEPSKG